MTSTGAIRISPPDGRGCNGFVFSLSHQAQALIESKKGRIADRQEAAVAVDRLESRGLAGQATQLRALAEDICTGDGGLPWGL